MFNDSGLNFVVCCCIFVLPVRSEESAVTSRGDIVIASTVTMISNIKKQKSYVII